MGSNKKSDFRLLCEDYCRKFEKMPDLTLAKKIYAENRNNPKAKSPESIRSNYIRCIRGNKGRLKRTQDSDKSLYKQLTHDTTPPKPYKEEIDAAKILVIDIETAPIRAFVWGIWQQNVAINQIDTDWFILTWAAKWLFDDKVYSGSVTPKEAVNQDDRRMLKGIWALLNEAEIVIAHNGQKFDISKLNTRFLVNEMQPPLPYQAIDTLIHIRRQFGFTSNKLDYVNKLLNLERKQETGGFELWDKCYKGDKEALVKMLDYNIQDVRILEDTYLRIRPWIKPHPSCNLNLLDGHERCPSCGSKDLISQDKTYNTYASKFELMRCGNCGSVARKRLSSLTITQKRHLTIPVAK